MKYKISYYRRINGLWTYETQVVEGDGEKIYLNLPTDTSLNSVVIEEVNNE